MSVFILKILWAALVFAAASACALLRFLCGTLGIVSEQAPPKVLGR